MKPKDVTTQMKALGECFLMVHGAVYVVAGQLRLIWTEKQGSYKIYQIQNFKIIKLSLIFA